MRGGVGSGEEGGEGAGEVGVIESDSYICLELRI